VVSHENPFDPANYSADDVLNIILSGLTTMGLGTLGAEVGPLSKFLSAHPIAGPAGYNAAGAALFGVIYQYWVLGKPVDRSTLETIAESSGISLGTGAGIGALGTVGGPVGRVLGSSPATEPAGSASPSALARALNGIGSATSTSKSDVVMNGVAVPASVIKYQFLISSPTPAPAVPPAPPAPPAVPVPRVPPPQAPGLPPGSATRVVQPGDSVWEIAGGDPALAERIAELNHLDDPSQIQPGQVLIVPPGP
jgi:LysM repeat protein